MKQDGKVDEEANCAGRAGKRRQQATWKVAED